MVHNSYYLHPNKNATTVSHSQAKTFCFELLSRVQICYVKETSRNVSLYHPGSASAANQSFQIKKRVGFSNHKTCSFMTVKNLYLLNNFPNRIVPVTEN